MTGDPPIRTVLVTGASRGLGAALAVAEAGPGTRLILIARSPERLRDVADLCRLAGADVVSACIDVRETDVLAAYVAATDARWPIDVAYANAGIEASLGPEGHAESLDVALNQLHTNIDGLVATVTPLLDAMRTRGKGAIVLVSSLAAFVPLPDQPAYCASKAAVLAWGEALAPWLAAAGVRLIVVCPGFIRTGMSEAYEGWRPLEWSAEKAARHIRRKIASGRSRIAFPLPLLALVTLGRMVPEPLRRWVIARFFRLGIDGSIGAN